MIRVGIQISPDTNWLGGANYYKNLIAAVNGIPKREVAFVLFVDPSIDSLQLKVFNDIDVVKTNLFKRFSLLWLLRKLAIKLLTRDILFERLLRKHHIDVLSHSGWLGEHASIPTIGWIPDFQHVHLPNFFSKSELNTRDNAFAEVCRYCSKVIVSSYDALKDLKAFAPNYADKAMVMQFAAPPFNQHAPIKPLSSLSKKYNFDGPYFLLPNQFWTHKNHKVVIEAISILKRDHINVTVLATGNTNDYRQPDFFSSIEELITQHDVVEEFKVLGMVPYEDLTALYFYATAIINPSFFEGWSTVVEEAKAMGKKIILSNIAIHLEQKPDFGFYFDPNSPAALAQLIHEQLSSEESNKDIDLFSIAEKNFIDYGERYQSLVKSVIKA